MHESGAARRRNGFWVWPSPRLVQLRAHSCQLRPGAAPGIGQRGLVGGGVELRRGRRGGGADLQGALSLLEAPSRGLAESTGCGCMLLNLLAAVACWPLSQSRGVGEATAGRWSAKSSQVVGRFRWCWSRPAQTASRGLKLCVWVKTKGWESFHDSDSLSVFPFARALAASASRRIQQTQKTGKTNDTIHCSQSRQQDLPETRPLRQQSASHLVLH